MENLFPDAGPKTENELLDYVAGVMIGLAREGKLSVTELLQQPRKVRDACGMVLLGQSWEDKSSELGRAANPVVGNEVPPELAQYKVKVRQAGEAKNPSHPQHGRITWRDGVKPRGQYLGKALSGKDGPNKPTVLYGAKIEERPGPEATLTLREAWLALKQRGPGAYGKRPATRERAHIIEETPRGKK